MFKLIFSLVNSVFLHVNTIDTFVSLIFSGEDNTMFVFTFVLFVPGGGAITTTGGPFGLICFLKHLYRLSSHRMFTLVVQDEGEPK